MAGIERALKKYPVVGLLAPRQVGKTTLAKKIQRSGSKKIIYLDLELPSDLNKLQSPLPPYCGNVKKRLIKSPKVYFRDSGLLHYLLRNKNLEDIQGHPGTGSSWEGFVVEQIAAALPGGWQIFFYRTGARAEKIY